MSEIPSMRELLDLHRIVISIDGVVRLSGSAKSAGSTPEEFHEVLRELIRMIESPDVPDPEVLGKHSPSPATVQPEEIPCRHCGKLPNDHYYGDQQLCERSTDERPRPAYEPTPQPAQPTCEKCGAPLAIKPGYSAVLEDCSQCVPQPAQTAGEKCAACRGSGLFDYDDGEVKCLNCGGTGVFGKQTTTQPCSRCAEFERALEKQHDEELRRWQDAIRTKLIELGAPDSIDGAGCDSGDPLDFTLSEICQGVNHHKDALFDLQAKVERMEVALREIRTLTCGVYSFPVDQKTNEIANAALAGEKKTT